VMLNLSACAPSPSRLPMRIPTSCQAVSEEVGSQPILFADLDSSVQRAVLEYLCDDSALCEWSEEDVVQLHWRLLKELEYLADPETPLADKLDTLRWVFTSPERDAGKFSFANCVRVVGTSPLSPTPYFGKVDVEAIRDWIRHKSKKWFRDTIARYPQWVQDLILDQPDWVEARLDRNPQWLNEQVKQLTDSAQLDMFQQGDAVKA
jgi:hypothetical protein